MADHASQARRDLLSLLERFEPVAETFEQAIAMAEADEGVDFLSALDILRPDMRQLGLSRLETHHESFADLYKRVLMIWLEQLNRQSDIMQMRLNTRGKYSAEQAQLFKRMGRVIDTLTAAATKIADRAEADRAQS